MSNQTLVPVVLLSDMHGKLGTLIGTYNSTEKPLKEQSLAWLSTGTQVEIGLLNDTRRTFLGWSGTFSLGDQIFPPILIKERQDNEYSQLWLARLKCELIMIWLISALDLPTNDDTHVVTEGPCHGNAIRVVRLSKSQSLELGLPPLVVALPLGSRGYAALTIRDTVDNLLKAASARMEGELGRAKRRLKDELRVNLR